MRILLKLSGEALAGDKKTGFSEYFIRKRIRDGTIPVVMCGNRAKMSISMLMNALNVRKG